MRLLHAVLGLLATGLTVAACTINQNDSRKNPELDEYTKYGGGGGGTTIVGGGGTGGEQCLPETCPDPPGDCQKADCVNGQCGAANEEDGVPCGVNGKSQCKNGACQCASAEQCTPADCTQVACVEGACKYTADGTLTCANGMGSCSDDGICGTCADRAQNGKETGIDCGINTPCGRCEGDSCAEATECESGFCVDGVCCDLACDGLCQACDQPGQTGKCSPLPAGTPDDACGSEGGCGETLGYCRCNDGVKNGDETDVDCGGATCGRKCGTGHQCTGEGDCISGHCTDGYCCSSACGAECSACNLPGLEGLCSAVAPSTSDDQCTGNKLCGALGTCASPGGETCNLKGQCISQACKNGTCVDSCTQDGDCNGSDVCHEGACYTKAPKGEPCPSSAACDAGLTCVDGVCCDSACDGLCMGCRFTYTTQPTGTCGPILDGLDPHHECPQPDPSQPGPGGAAHCSGAPPDLNGNSSCGVPSP